MQAMGTGGPIVYGHPGTRSPLVDWYLHEVGTPFENRMPNHPSNPHPFGQVPALEDDDGAVSVWESGAILLYLADRCVLRPWHTANRLPRP